MAANWITYERRLYKETQQLMNTLLDGDENLSPSDAWEQAYATNKMHLLAQWKRAINLEIEFTTLREKMLEEAGLNKKVTKEEKPKFTFGIDITFPENTPIPTRLEFTKELNQNLESNSLELAFEQRGNTDESTGHGLHVHTITKFNKSTTKQDIISKASPICKKYGLKSNILQIEKIDTQQYLENRSNYIRGIKQGVDKDGIPKMDKVPFDKLMRERLKLEDIYTRDNLHLIHGAPLPPHKWAGNGTPVFPCENPTGAISKPTRWPQENGETIPISIENKKKILEWT